MRFAGVCIKISPTESPIVRKKLVIITNLFKGQVHIFKKFKEKKVFNPRKDKPQNPYQNVPVNQQRQQNHD